MSDSAPRSALLELSLVRLREFIREPEAVFWTLIFPIVLAAGLGLAFRHRPTDTVPIAVVVASRDSSGGMRGIVDSLTRTAGLAAKELSETDAARALATGAVALVVARTDTGVEYRYDVSRPEARTARLLVNAAVQRAAGRIDPVRIEERLVSERGSRYIDFLVPGLLGMNLMGSGIWGVGFSIVDARRRRLLKRLVATPMRRSDYLASFLISRLGLLVIEVLALLGFGAAVGVPLRGPLLPLATICLLAALAFGGMGLLIASRAQTIQGASGLMNLVMMPMWIFSGVFFSASNFPDAVQPFIQSLPLTAVNDALRANMLQGAGWQGMVGDMGVVAFWLVVCFGAALKLFRWR